MRIKAFEETFGRLRRVQRGLVKMVSALRSELNLDRNDERFMRQLKDMEQRAWTALNQVYGIDPPYVMRDIDELG